MKRSPNLVHDPSQWGHQASSVESWRVTLGKRDERYFAGVKSAVYDDTNLGGLAEKVIRFDQTFQRKFEVVSGSVISPASKKPIKGVKPVEVYVAEHLSALIEDMRKSVRGVKEEDLLKQGWERDHYWQGGPNATYRNEKSAPFSSVLGRDLGLR